MNAVIEFLNAAGEWFVSFALPMLIQSSVLILVILGIDFLIRKRVRAVFRYGLWMLVLVKLMLPTSLSSPTGLGYWLGIPMPEIPHPSEVSTSPAQEPMALLTGDPLEPIYQELENPILFPSEAEMMDYETPPIHSPVNQSESVAGATPASTPTPPAPIPDITWQGILILVWLLIVLILFLLLIQRVLFVRQLVAQAKDAKGTVITVFNQCREKLGIHKPIPIKLSVNATGPSVCGLMHPVILFPYSLLPQLNREERESVLLHELAHIQRRDLWVNLVQTILQVLYFFHPLVWLANAMIRRIREQAVDEAVLVAMQREAEEYSNTLVRVFRMSLQRPALSLRLIGVVESKKSLTTRIKHMLSRPLPKSAKLGILGVLTVFLLGAILLPMAEARRMQEESEAAVSAETAKPEGNLKSDFAPDDPGKGDREDLLPKAEAITEPSVEWGEPIQGVQVGARMEKERWRIGGNVPRIHVEVRISDPEEFQTSGLDTRQMYHDNSSFILDVDGRQYKDRAMYTTRPVPLQSPFKITLYLDNGWESTRPLQLESGRHTIRVLFVGLGMTRAVGPFEIEVLPDNTKLEPWPYPWGKAVAGVQVSACPVKPVWPVGSEPVIRVRLRNQGVAPLPSIHLWPRSFALEVDGKRYENNFIFHAWQRPFPPGTEYEYDLKLSKNRPFHDGLRKGNVWPPVGKSPPLLPGKHTVRVMFTELRIQPEPASQLVEFEIQSPSEQESAWGKPIEGVQCRLQPKRNPWHVREAPQFLVYARAVDDDADLLLSSSVLYGCQVEVDGQWYDYWAPQEFVGPAYIPCKQMQAREQGLDVTLTPHQYHSVKEKRALVLPVGKHTVRFAWAAYRSDYKTNPPKERPPLRVISNPVEIEILAIENEFLQQQAEKYFRAAQTSAQGSPKNPEYTIECIRKALQYPQSDVNRAQLYVYWGDMIQIQTPNYRPEVWGPQRKKAAEIYLEGLHEVLKHNLPADPPELPVVERFTVDGPPEIVEKYRKINELQVQLRKETMRVRKLIQLRQALTGQLVQMYAREPDAFGELNELVVGYVHSSQAAKQIIATARDYRKNSKTPFPAIVLEPGRDYQFWGNPVDGVQCRLRMEKSTWPQGSIPKLFADLRNRGQQNLRIALESESWELEIDGQWHKPNTGWSGRRRYLPLSPGQQQQNLEVWLPAVDNLAHQLQALQPGKHTIRIARLFNDPWRPGNEVLRVVSNPVEIEIASVGKDNDPWGKMVNGIQVSLRPEKQIYKQGENPAIRVGIRNWGSTVLKTNAFASVGLEVDGQTYTPKSWDRPADKPVRPFYPKTGWTVATSLGEYGLDTKKLTPGKHIIRALYLKEKKPVPENYRDILALSLPVEIEIVAELDQVVIDLIRAEGYLYGASSIWIGYEQLTEEVLRERIVHVLKESPDPKVVIRADRSIPFKDVAHLQNILKTMGVENISMAVFPLRSIFAISPAPGRDGVIRGKVIAPNQSGENVNYVVSLDHELWTTHLGELPNLEVAAGETFEFRNVPAGKCKVQAQPVIPAGRDSALTKKTVAVDVIVKNKQVLEVELSFAKSQASSVWDPAGDGVQVRLHSNKKIWNQGDDPGFKVDFRNNGTRELKTSLIASLALEIDGKSYTPGIWRSLTAIRVLPFGPGKEYSVDIKLSQFAAGRKGPKAVELAPGWHTIKAVYLDNVSDDGRSHYASLDRALASSNPVEISIILVEHKWSAPVNGLRAAVEFVPEKASYTQGESVAVRFHIQNVSDSDIEFKSVSTRQDYARVKDKDGNEVRVRRRFHSGTVYTRNHTIKPTDVLVLKTTGLGFAEVEDQTLDEFKSNKDFYVGSILRSKPGTVAIHYNVNRDLKTGVRKVKIVEKPQIAAKQMTMKEVVQTLARKYRVRICFEDITDIAIADIAVQPYRLTGNFKAQTIPPLLDQITQSGPFTWVKYNDTYVVYPRKNSLLEFPASLNIDDSPLEFVTRKVLDKIPAGKEIEIKSPVSVAPDVNKRGDVRHLWISSSPVRYALTRAAEESGRGDTEIVWTFTQEQGRNRLTFHYLPPPTATSSEGAF